MAIQRFRRGGVSMFLVIVVGSLISLMVASYLRIVIRDQQEASNFDLSQSAHDSAQAGVEDAKRALLLFHKTCADSTKINECDNMRRELSKSLNDQSCRILAETFNIGDRDANETIIQTNKSDKSLNQAYTCVKINPDTVNFEGRLNSADSKIIPLDSNKDIRFIKVSWHTRFDNSNNSDVKLLSANNDMLGLLSKREEWDRSKFPSIVRAQIIKSGSFDYSNIVESDKNISRTVFLFPSDFGNKDASLNGTIVKAQKTETRHNFSRDSFSAIRCDNNLDIVTYACSAIIELDSDIPSGGGAIMKLSTQYGDITNYSVELFSADRLRANFIGVQPLIDSTGRAGDKFHRIQSRVEMYSPLLPIPDYAVSTDSKFCKAMIIRDSTKKSTVECK